MVFSPPAALAQETGSSSPSGELEGDRVQLDFNDVELKVVIDTIARLTGRNFIYDDRVRGKITVVSPTPITIEEAYAVFESVLRVKGFTTVEAPGGVIKIIPLSEAKESNVELQSGAKAPPPSERFVTRLIPLRYIDAAAIADTLRPFVSKDALLVAYAPTNTVILTDSATNIGRILSVVQAIDVETYRAELTRIRLVHADPGTVAAQLSEIFGAEVSAVGGSSARPGRGGQAGAAPKGAELAAKGGVRIITDERTNALFILASRQRMDEIRDVVARLDVPVTGSGRIHIYYIKHADAEELANTLAAILSGQPSPSSGGGAAKAADRAGVSEFASGVTVTADPPTNSIVIQATAEGYTRLKQVIEGLDIPRPQVLVEALIMEVDVTDAIDLGFSGLVRIQDGEDGRFVVGSLTDTILGSGEGDEPSGVLDALLGAIASDPTNFIGGAAVDAGSTLIQGLIRASASVNGTNILSAPHILTLDNEEAEIKVGDNIPIITSRVQSAAGIETDGNGSGSLATSQNIERQDIGITLRVTPQISEGDRLRLQIFQEVTAVNEGLTGVTGSVDQVGVALSNRKIENVVTVADEETVVIGGLIDEAQAATESKVPWLGDIPILGWLFKTTGDSIRKRNLLVFLTPHIIRDSDRHVRETIRKREEFSVSSEAEATLSESQREAAEQRKAERRAAGMTELPRDPSPVRSRLEEHRERYPVEIMREIEGEATRARRDRWSAIASFTELAAATSALHGILEAGESASLTTEDRAGARRYVIRLGPFETQDRALAAVERLIPRTQATMIHESDSLPIRVETLEPASGDRTATP